ncbi:MULTISPECIES: FAD/NAD(P)-binding protein [Pseudomonas]|uniref:Pyridine nucleotide-disulfide oxidoreductase n=1 Tax=Pseudomonas quercus TaxID=2722792 RepID=A0ABX0YCD4_9PSED|nr:MULTISPECIES: FAD/NAD(P)-binding protein [Pseudomonas]MBF7141217.1 FAD/NAD(P)-binding protein [Pseudomonas sp. LY10J]NJO99752.1 pyridine nucleotide-disulfide oxidoreductase [Pseudomonas quercus]
MSGIQLGADGGRYADVAIVGGGLSGALLAMQLLHRPGPRRIVICEPRAQVGRGEAYSAVALSHTLNGNAARMSIDPDAPDDLTHWLTAYIDGGGWPESALQQVPVAQLFPPREVFGTYARQRLAEALASSPGSTLEHAQAEVVDLCINEQGATLVLEGGVQWQAARVVLATGVFTAVRTQRTGNAAFSGLDPWDIQAMAALPKDGRVIIVGAGLTMIDALLSLEQAGHQGPIQVFSRHGLLPQPRRQPPDWEDFLAHWEGPATPRALSTELRRHCRLAAEQGVDWQAPLDTVRAHVGRLWHQASEFHQRQFVRHLRPWWESHHHRSPPQGAALLQRLRTEGRLSIEAASLQSVVSTTQGVQLALRRRGEAATCLIEGAAVINSSGIEYDWRRVAKPLPQRLLAQGLVKPGPLALGIDADDGGAVRDAAGQASSVLFSLGPPLRGLWWESTAVTDVAAQAKALAIRLASTVSNLLPR